MDLTLPGQVLLWVEKGGGMDRLPSGGIGDPSRGFVMS